MIEEYMEFCLGVYFTVGKHRNILLHGYPGSSMFCPLSNLFIVLILTHYLTELQLKIIRAHPRALMRVPVEYYASEVPLAGWSVCLASKLIASWWIPQLRQSRNRGEFQVKHNWDSEWQKKEQEVGSPLVRRLRKGAAPRVLCAQSCQRSRGEIVEKVAASRSEEERGAAGARRWVTERWYGRGWRAKRMRRSSAD